MAGAPASGKEKIIPKLRFGLEEGRRRIGYKQLRAGSALRVSPPDLEFA